MFVCKKQDWILRVFDFRSGLGKKNRNETIRNFPAPMGISDVRSFCGLVNYFGRFISDLATKMSPTSELLKSKATEFQWTKQPQEALERIKE